MSSPDTNAGSTAERRDGLLLPGLDGANPLGFLAALGLLKVLSDPGIFEVLGMNWTKSAGTWVPVLHASGGPALEQESLLKVLNDRLVNNINSHPAKLLQELQNAADSLEKRREIFAQGVTGGDRIRLDWISSLASDFAPPKSINQLQTTRRDNFYRNLKSVIARNKSEHLRRSIFHPWDYADALDNQSLHWDPSEDRRHANQWNEPSGDPHRNKHGGMLGANRLALEAIPLFPSFPESDTLRTVGFTGVRSTDTRWTWPLWGHKSSLPIVRSLLTLEPLQCERLKPDDIAALKARGIVAAYRTSRILVGKTPNFTPARCIL